MQFHRQIVTKRPLSVWNSLIQASTRDGLFAESLHLYCSMLRTGIHGDNFTFPFIAKACAKLNSLRDGTKIHGHVLLMGFQQDVFVQTALIDMYSKCSNLAASRQVFDEMTFRSLVTWNSIISTYCREFQTDESFRLLKQMQVLDLEPNSSTFVSLVLGCCGSVSVLQQGLSIHGCVFKLGCDSDLLLSNSIMSMYVRFDIVDTARSLFDSMEEKSNVSWTTIMGGYLKIGDFGEVFNLFNQMQQERISLDSITFVNLVSSCAQIGRLSMGSSIHSLVIKSGCDHEDIIATSLVSMYSKCGDLISARKKFDSMHAKSVFLWTSMIGGYVHGGHANEALNLFENLLMTGVQPNEVTLTTVLSACGYFGSLGIGKRVEEYVKASGFEYDLRVQTSLIHMYCKCGCIERAKEIFDGVSNKDLTVWSSMINAYAIHGKGEEALTLFRKMQREEGIKPDAVVFTAVLSACSHSGLVDEGLKYFCSMERDFNVKPSVEHYSCLVDLLGRAGCFSLALKTILEMPTEAQARAWAPLLSACRTHRKIQLGEYVAKRLFELDPSSTANYILMANMYASVGKWKEAAEMRRWMNDRGLVKEPGWSKIEVDGLSHVFLVGDQSHHRSVEIYEKLEELNGKLREAGYAAETDMVMHDLETEEKENSLKVHSERLAVAFGLLATEMGSRLTIIKNLRTCCDCHSYLKFVSRVTGRHLIVRDGYRFHHFEFGVCSCGEFCKKGRVVEMFPKTRGRSRSCSPRPRYRDDYKGRDNRRRSSSRSRDRYDRDRNRGRESDHHRRSRSRSASPADYKGCSKGRVDDEPRRAGAGQWTVDLLLGAVLALEGAHLHVGHLPVIEVLIGAVLLKNDLLLQQVFHHKDIGVLILEVCPHITQMAMTDAGVWIPCLVMPEGRCISVGYAG